MESSQPSGTQEMEWIRRAQEGDREAFGHLVERYQRRVFSLVFRLLHRRDEVEDIAQEIRQLTDDTLNQFPKPQKRSA